MRTEIFSYKNFKNVTVKNKNGDNLGEIHDVLLDTQTGEIACLLLASGGFLGMGEKYLPIPYEALSYNPNEDTYYLDVPKDKFKGAPQLDLGNNATRADRKYIKDVYSYYGYKPGF